MTLKKFEMLTQWLIQGGFKVPQKSYFEIDFVEEQSDRNSLIEQSDRNALITVVLLEVIAMRDKEDC